MSHDQVLLEEGTDGTKSEGELLRALQLFDSDYCLT